MNPGELVLVVPTQVLHEAGHFHGLQRRVDHYLSRLLEPSVLRFVPRAGAENDPSLKQIIPYVVLRWQGQIFQYTRGQKTTEKRLRALRSLGVGGHINPCDQAGTGDPYRQGMLREVDEEVFLESAYKERCLGIINDDSTPVGQVHLGIVHLFDLVEPKVRKREAGLTQSGFAPLDELIERKREFETWSQFVLEELANETKGSGR